MLGRIRSRGLRAWWGAIFLASAAACESDILLGLRTPDDLDAGGGSGGSTFPDGGSIADVGPRPDITGDPCTDYANHLCELEQSCNLLLFRNLLWGDLATCKERRRLRCAARLAAPGAGDTPARLNACVAALSRFTCAQYGDFGNWPETCDAPGTRVDGAACALGAQCRGGGCFPPDGQACGTCTTLPGVGAPCSGVCQNLLQCHNGTCVAYLKQGESCRYGGPYCAYGLACIGASTGQGKCLQHLGLGATCDPNAIECNDTIGLTCDNMTRVCRAESGWPGPGEPCLVGQLCRADAWCNFFNRCEPRRREGEPCGTSANSPVCLQPAICVGNVCTLPDGIVCR